MKRHVLLCAAIVAVFGFALFFNHELAATRAAKSSAVSAIAPVITEPVAAPPPRRITTRYETMSRYCSNLRAVTGAAEYDQSIRHIELMRAQAQENIGYARTLFDHIGMTWENISQFTPDEIIWRIHVCLHPVDATFEQDKEAIRNLSTTDADAVALTEVTVYTPGQARALEAAVRSAAAFDKYKASK